MEVAKYKKIILLIAAIVIAVGFVANYVVTAFVMSGDRTYVCTTQEKAQGETVSAVVDITKVWKERNSKTGAEYDWTLYNATEEKIEDWSVTMDVGDDVKVDSIWNVEYEISDGVMTLTPDPEIPDSSIAPHDMRTFGMVLHTPGLYDPGEVTITAEVKLRPTRMPFFSFLLLCAFFWIIFAIQYISEVRVTARLKRRQELDKEIILQSMNTFVSFIDAKDPYTKGHSQRVAAVAAELGKRMGLDETDVDHLYYAGILHDAGKIGIPDDILKKVGILSPDEFKVIKRHTVIGGQMLDGFTSIEEIREGALYHHERFDGNGYPQGLKGEDIPLFGRIICVADSYDAMARDRCYRKHLEKEKILRELETHAGSQFDPAIVPYMIDMINDGTADRLTESL